MKKSSFHFSGIASEQGWPVTLDNRADLRPPGFIPCQDDPDTCYCAPRIVGSSGRTRVPWVDTPSLNPGLWYKLVSSHCEPPSSEKNEIGGSGDRRACPARPG